MEDAVFLLERGDNQLVVTWDPANNPADQDMKHQSRSSYCVS